MNFQGNIRTWAANQIASYVMDTGNVDAYAVSLRPVITSYTEGLLLRFKALQSNTGPCTLSVNGLANIPIKKNVTEDLITDDILQDEIVEVIFDGTNWQMIGGSSFSLNTVDTNTIHLFGTGTVLDPLYAEAQISGFPNNAIQIFEDGLYVANTIQQGVVYGGIVTWLGDYDFHVSAAGYYINGAFYESPEAFITLSPSDPLLDRIDTFIVDDTGTASVLEGTPAVSPSQAPLDPATQLELSIVLVQAASTNPGVNTECIYLENTEWGSSPSSPFVDPDSLLNPCTGIKSVEFTNTGNNQYVLFTYAGAPFNVNTNYNVLTFKIRSKGAWGNPNRRLNIQWELAGAPVGNVVQLWNNSPYGFDSSNTATCQIISIPLANFGLPANALINSIRFRVSAPNGSIGFHLDDICLQGTITPPPPPTGGTSGTSGTSGQNGTSGTSGNNGTSGTSAATNGTSGSSGTSGTSAATSGVSGTSGSSGTSGVNGNTGTSGTSGVNGNSGTSGTSGVNGNNGTSGSSGTSGFNGLAGTSGSSGTSAVGIPGTSGTSGTSATASGTSGTSGSSGTSAATSGTSGINGTSGTSGVDGTSGINGTSGTSGIDGSGTSGSSGTSGTSPAANGPYSVTNGLNENPANVFRWGGTLDSTTTINCLGFESVFTGTAVPLRVTKTGAASTNAINASGSGSSPTIQSTTNSGSGSGILGWNNSTGIGVDGWSLATHAIQGRRTAATNNDIVSVGNLLRLSQSGSSNGIGGYLNYQIQNSGGFGVDAGRVAVKWTDNTNTLEDSQMEFWLKSAGTIAKKASISDIGQWTWDTYGSGTHTGAPTRYLGVTSTGAVIEVDVPTGSSYTFTNGLTESPAGTVKLGGTLIENTTITQSTFNLTFASSATTGTTTSSALVFTGNSLTSGTGMYLSSTSLSSGSLMNISINSTAAASNLQTGVNINMSGANANSNQSTYGIRASNTHTGTGSINYGIHSTASGASGVNVGVYGTGSRGIWGNTSTAFGTGVYGESTVSGSAGWFIGSSSALGIQVNSVNAETIAAIRNPSSTNSVVTILQLDRLTTGTAANGIGGSIALRLEDDSTATVTSNAIIWDYLNAANATRNSRLSFQCINGTTLETKLEVRGDDNIIITQGLQDFADDTAAGAGGIPINGLYRNGSIVQIRVI